MHAPQGLPPHRGRTVSASTGQRRGAPPPPPPPPPPLPARRAPPPPRRGRARSGVPPLIICGRLLSPASIERPFYHRVLPGSSNGPQGLHPFRAPGVPLGDPHARACCLFKDRFPKSSLG